MKIYVHHGRYEEVKNALLYTIKTNEQVDMTIKITLDTSATNEYQNVEFNIQIMIEARVEDDNAFNSIVIGVLPKTGQSTLIYHAILLLIAITLICIAIVLLKRDKKEDQGIEKTYYINSNWY